MADETQNFVTCPSCRTRVREGQMHTGGPGRGAPECKPLFLVVRDRVSEDDEGRQLLYGMLSVPDNAQMGRTVTGLLEFVDGGEESMDYWEVVR